MLVVKLLGQFNTQLNDRPLDLPSRPAQTLFAYFTFIVLIDGGLYAGDGGRFSITVSGNPPPPVDVVDPCTGSQVVGTTPNYNAQPQEPPVLYDLADYQPGGQSAILAGANYHYIAGNFSPPIDRRYCSSGWNGDDNV